jgi:hypothetical protein
MNVVMGNTRRKRCRCVNIRWKTKRKEGRGETRKRNKVGDEGQKLKN